jgi:hypothetical protein
MHKANSKRIMDHPLHLRSTTSTPNHWRCQPRSLGRRIFHHHRLRRLLPCPLTRLIRYLRSKIRMPILACLVPHNTGPARILLCPQLRLTLHIKVMHLRRQRTIRINPLRNIPHNNNPLRICHFSLLHHQCLTRMRRRRHSSNSRILTSRICLRLRKGLGNILEDMKGDRTYRVCI